MLAADGLSLRTTTDLDTALRGADVIFAALRVGGLDGRVADERSALDAGVIRADTIDASGTPDSSTTSGTLRSTTLPASSRARTPSR